MQARAKEPQPFCACKAPSTRASIYHTRAVNSGKPIMIDTALQLSAGACKAVYFLAKEIDDVRKRKSGFGEFAGCAFFGPATDHIVDRVIFPQGCRRTKYCVCLLCLTCMIFNKVYRAGALKP